MPYRTGDNVDFYGWFTQNKLGASASLVGSPVIANIYDPAGNQIRVGTADRVHDGLYKFTLSSPAPGTPGTYLSVFRAPGTALDYRDSPGFAEVGVGGWDNIHRLDMHLSSVNQNLNIVGGNVSAILNNGVSVDAGAVADALLDLADGIEEGLTLRETMRLIVAILAGKADVSTGQSTVTYKRKDGTTAAITITFDADGNRSTVNYQDLD